MNLFISWIVNFIILSDWIGSLVKSFKMFKVYIISVHFTYILTSARIVVFNIVDIKLLAHPCDSINFWEFTFFKRNAKQTSKPESHVLCFFRGCEAECQEQSRFTSSSWNSCSGGYKKLLSSPIHIHYEVSLWACYCKPLVMYLVRGRALARFNSVWFWLKNGIFK